MMHPNSNNDQRDFSSITTIRRNSRPGNINLPTMHLQQIVNPETFSAPIRYLKTNNDQVAFNNGPLTSALVYPSNYSYHRPTLIENPLSIYCPPTMEHGYEELHRTSRTHPLQNSPNHCEQYFQFPPVMVQNSHRTVRSAATVNTQTNWSNPVLSPLIVKRINESSATMNNDDLDEDPSASIDALVADDESNSTDLITRQHNTSLRSTSRSSHRETGAISPTDHVLTTPPNPLASNDHPGPPLTIGSCFGSTCGPLSAGFQTTLTPGSSIFNFTQRQSHDLANVGLDQSRLYGQGSIIGSIHLHNDNSNSKSSRAPSQISQSPENTRFSTPSPNQREQSSSPNDSNSANKLACNHPECRKTFANKSALAKHKLTHTEDRKHKCSTCGKGFKRLDHLNGHIMTHQEEKPNKCLFPQCNRTFCDTRSLKRHIEGSHQDYLAKIFHNEGDELRQYLPEKSTVVIKTDGNNNGIDNTSALSISSIPIYTYEEAKSVQCNVCHRAFKNLAALNGHMRLHGGLADKPSINYEQPKPVTTPKRKPRDYGNNQPKQRKTSSTTIIKIEPVNVVPDSSLPETLPLTLSDKRIPCAPTSTNLIISDLDHKLPLMRTNPTPPAIVQEIPHTHESQYMDTTRSPSVPGLFSGVDDASPDVIDKTEPNENQPSQFMIKESSSSATSSASSSSNNQHFTYDNVPEHKILHRTTSSTHWLSQFRREYSNSQSNNNISLNSHLSVPYTPPPMLSPYRRGAGLYYRTFSQSNGNENLNDCNSFQAVTDSQAVTEDPSSPKINVGDEYQADIPKFRRNINPSEEKVIEDELLYSASELSHIDETLIETWEKLSQQQPTLLSSRQSPKMYPLELFYMLLYEYKGDFERTLNTMLNGVAKDIKKCRPLHKYRFTQCDEWTFEEIQKFDEAFAESEKNFEIISQKIQSKTIKQCVEFYYMPRISIKGRRPTTKVKSSIVTRKRRTEILEGKDNFLPTLFDQERSLSPYNEPRYNVFACREENSFCCDYESCSKSFSTNRALRGHRKEHKSTTSSNKRN